MAADSSDQQQPAEQLSEIRTCPECGSQFLMSPQDQLRQHNPNCHWMCRFLCGECLRLEKFRPKLWESSLAKVVLAQKQQLES